MHQFDFGALFENSGVLHPRRIMRRFEGDSAIHQHHRHQMLKRYVGYFAIVHDGRLICRHPYREFLHLIGTEVIFLYQVQ